MPRTVRGAPASSVSASPSGSKAASLQLPPSGPRRTPEALRRRGPSHIRGDQEAPGPAPSRCRSWTSVATPGPAEPPAPAVPTTSQERARRSRAVAGGRGSGPGCPQPRSPGQKGTKGFQEREPATGQAAPRPPLPGPFANRPPGLPWRQVTGPEDPGAQAASGAMGRAAARTARFQGFDPTDSGRDPG